MSALIRALIDFPDGTTKRPRRLHFESPSVIFRAEQLGDVVHALDATERAARDGAWVVGFVSYDAGPAFDSALAAMPRGRLPYAWFAVFPHGPTVTERPGGHADPTLGSLPPARPAISATHYAASVARIREYIAAGDVYQVNYAVPFVIRESAAPPLLYEQLRVAQGGEYSAYLHLGDAELMSASPELFFERRGNVVRARPMKGTARRGLSSSDDDAARDTLLRSEKNRAENVMIVDLVRSDIGRIARTGSVRVVSLWDAERYPHVWQLTSTVEGEVAPDVPLSAVFRALFPSGSVTGAPKIRATQIIRELEGAPREVYCGAIGVLRPGGDAVFNVAIRTAWTDNAGMTVHLNAGGGITMDSTAASEWDEVRAKVTAFTTPQVVPALFETLRVEYGVPLRLARHLTRLGSSARYFGISYDASEARDVLVQAAWDSGEMAVARGRLELHPDGTLRAEMIPFPADAPAQPQRVALAASSVSRRALGLYHKTTDRAMYETALSARPGVFDVILWNEEHEATELTRGNLVVELGGRLCTPPVASGLLPGTLRGELLEQGKIIEQIVRVDELRTAKALWFVNALRGWIQIQVDPCGT